MVPLIEDSVKTLVEIVGDSADTGKSIDFFRYEIPGEITNIRTHPSLLYTSYI